MRAKDSIGGMEWKGRSAARSRYSALALLGLVGWLVIGCNPAGESGHRKPIELVLLTGGGAVEPACKKEVERFEREHPEIRVELISAVGEQYYTKALTMLAGRARLDVMWMGEGFGMFAARGALLDLDDMVRDDPDFDLQNYFAPVLDWYRYGGKLYGFPYGIDLQVLAYNQDLFDQAHVPYPSDSWTLDQLLEAAKKLTRDKDGDGRTDQYGLGVSEIRYGVFGANLLTADQQRFALNNADGLAWLQFNLDLIAKHKVLHNVADVESQTLDRMLAFNIGRVAIVDCFTWDLQEMKKQLNFRWDVVVASKGKRRSAWASSAGFAIAAHTPHPRESWRLLKYLVSPQFQRTMLERSIPTYLPLQTEFVRANQPTPKNSQAFVESLAWLNPKPRIGCQHEVIAELNQWKQRAFLGQLSPAAALAQAEIHINQILEEDRNR
ncbi:MAG: sugar ABC transporter substrate-binding protein [Verrucomicrobia bacterium]|nr:sugar ABC transporter substrate-binding protein [Verrucomicrobiota bacterium]